MGLLGAIKIIDSMFTFRAIVVNNFSIFWSGIQSVVVSGPPAANGTAPTLEPGFTVRKLSALEMIHHCQKKHSRPPLSGTPKSSQITPRSRTWNQFSLDTVSSNLPPSISNSCHLEQLLCFPRILEIADAYCYRIDCCYYHCRALKVLQAYCPGARFSKALTTFRSQKAICKKYDPLILQSHYFNKSSR